MVESSNCVNSVPTSTYILVSVFLLCFCPLDYPWRWNTPVLMNSALIKWIYLPDFYTVPNSKNLIGQFVCICHCVCVPFCMSFIVSVNLFILLS